MPMPASLYFSLRYQPATFVGNDDTPAKIAHSIEQVLNDEHFYEENTLSAEPAQKRQQLNHNLGILEDIRGSLHAATLECLEDLHHASQQTGLLLEYLQQVDASVTAVKNQLTQQLCLCTIKEVK